MDRMMRAPAGTDGRDRTEVPLGEIEGPDGERYEHALVIDKPAGRPGYDEEQRGRDEDRMMREELAAQDEDEARDMMEEDERLYGPMPAAGRPHPWYGPCDAMGPDGACSECTGKLQRKDGSVVSALTGSPPSAAGRLAQGPSEQQRCGFCGGLHVGMCSAVVLRSQVARLREEKEAAEKEAERLRGDLHSWKQYYKIPGAPGQFAAENNALRALLREIREELDQEADVDDGTPNLAMRLLGMIDGAALSEEETKA